MRDLIRTALLQCIWEKLGAPLDGLLMEAESSGKPKLKQCTSGGYQSTSGGYQSTVHLTG